MNRFLQAFSIFDLMIISLMATLGIAIKPVVVPLVHFISGPLMIPGGALAGGLYMMWLVVGFGIVGKYGTGTFIAFVQAILVTILGVTGSHGILSLISYTMPGIMMDLVLLGLRHKVCCRQCSFIAGAVANVTGTIAVNLVFFQLPVFFLILALAISLLSGGIGGLLAWELLKVLRKHQIIKHGRIQGSNESRESKESKEVSRYDSKTTSDNE